MSFKNLPGQFTLSLREARFPWAANPASWRPEPLFMVSGPRGAGKSHGVADAVFRRILAGFARTAFYTTHAEMMTSISRAIEHGRSKASVMDELKSTDILVIDEFCATDSDMRDTSSSAVREVVLHRADRVARDGAAEPSRTILITNRTPEWLADHVEEALWHRISDPQRGVGFMYEVKVRDLRASNLGPPYVMPEPEWWPLVHATLSEVRDSVLGGTFTVPQLQHRRGLGYCVCWAMTCRKFPAEAWQWLNDHKPAGYETLLKLREFRNE